MWQIKSLSKALLQTGEPTALNPLNFSTQLQDPDHWVAILMQHDSRTPLGECMLGYFMCCPSSKDQTLLFLPAAKHAGGAGGSHPLAWTKLDGSLGLHLPPNSLIFAELVQEKSGLPPHHSPLSVYRPPHCTLSMPPLWGDLNFRAWTMQIDWPSAHTVDLLWTEQAAPTFPEEALSQGLYPMARIPPACPRSQDGATCQASPSPAPPG